MKQPEDKLTIEMYDIPEPKGERCVFWLEVGDHRLEWRPLTKTQAVRMYKCTERNTPDNVTRYGWEVID